MSKQTNKNPRRKDNLAKPRQGEGLDLPEEKVILTRLIYWAEAQPIIRAMLLTSSRADPNALTDIFSDYDVILIVSDVQPFYEERAWLDAFGQVLALYRDPLEPYLGCLKSGYVVQYEDGLKIDFVLWPVEILQRIVAEPELPDEFDAGYRVLLDKDLLTLDLKSPTYQAYLPTPPSEAEYQAVVEVFFLESAYVAKLLWRQDLMAAKHLLDHFMKQEHLLPMLEWRLEIYHGWTVKPGPYGRGLKRWLRPDLWAALESTFCGAGMEENWAALFKTIALFHTTACEVGDQLGYAYPHDLEQRALAYLHNVKALERGAESFR